MRTLPRDSFLVLAPIWFVVATAYWVSGCAGTDSNLRRAWEDQDPNRTRPELARSVDAEGTEAGRVAGGTEAAEAGAGKGAPGVNEASPAGDRAITTESELLSLLRERSPGVRASWHRWEAALEQIPQAGSLPDPMVTYKLQTRVTPRQQQFGVMQSFPIGKLGLRSDVAAEGARVADAEHEMTWWDIRGAALSLWYELYRLDRAIETTARHIGILESWEAVARRSYAAGNADYATVLRAQVELVQLRDGLDTVKEQRTAVTARLNAELDRAPEAPIEPPASLGGDFDAPPLADLDPELDTAPRLRADLHRETMAKTESRLASRSAWPEVQLGVQYMDMGDGGMDGSATDPIMLEAGISVPLWFSQHRARAEQARAGASAAAEERIRTSRALEAELRGVHASWRDADRRLRLYSEDQLPRVEQTILVTEERFVAGQATFLDLLDLERTALDLELRLEEARAERAMRRAELEALLGRELGPQGGVR